MSGTTAALRGTLGHWLPYGAFLGALVALWPFVRRQPWSARVLDWFPLPFVVVTYDMLHAVSPRTWTWTIDPALRDADRALLGTDAVELLRPVVQPWLTATLAACYASYYVVPLFAGIWLWSRRPRVAFRELMIAETGALFVGYLGYLFLPAQGPHVFLAGEGLGGSLAGDFMTPFIHARAEAHHGLFPRDAFPSLHTANAVSLLLTTWRHDRRSFAAVLVPMAGLLAATVYLRFHYVVDVAAGALLAVLWQGVAAAAARRETASA